MGLNTEPTFEMPEIKNENAREHYEMEQKDALRLRDEIIECVEKNGECSLSWSCTGRTRHVMHAEQWKEAMPQYNFEIDYDSYGCIVRKK